MLRPGESPVPNSYSYFSSSFLILVKLPPCPEAVLPTPYLAVVFRPHAPSTSYFTELLNTAGAGRPVSASHAADTRLAVTDLTTPSRSQGTRKTTDQISRLQGRRSQWDPESYNRLSVPPMHRHDHQENQGD